jgi:hypothetical protein
MTPLFVQYEMHAALLYLSSVFIPVSRENYREMMKLMIKQCYIVEKKVYIQSDSFCSLKWVNCSLKVRYKHFYKLVK